MVSFHLTYGTNKGVLKSHNQVHSSLNFLFFGVIFFFPFAGELCGVAAAWLLVTGLGLLVVAAAWLLVIGPGLLVVATSWFLVLVGVDGIKLLTETSNHGDAFFFPFSFLQE
jgi:hypothetical protein